MSIFQSTRAEKAAKQLATNIEKLDALAAAQALLAKVRLNIATRRADLDRLDAELGELAIRKADGEDIDAGAKLSKRDAAQSELRLAEAALLPAQQRVAAATADARRNALAGSLKLVAKFNKKRSEAAAAMSVAIEALDKAWQQFHEANTAMRMSWTAGPFPVLGTLTGGDFEAAFKSELFRLAGRPNLYGGSALAAPSLPGALSPSILHNNPLALTPLVDQVDAANKMIVRALEGEPSTSGLEDVLS